jgi:hypothetical protein
MNDNVSNVRYCDRVRSCGSKRAQLFDGRYYTCYVRKRHKYSRVLAEREISTSSHF